MPSALVPVLQVLFFAAFGAGIVAFSNAPSYRHFPPDLALVRLAFEHAGTRRGACRRYTPAELEAMPANMRRPLDCPRGRVPLAVEFEIDGQIVYRGEHESAGLSADGPAMVYSRFPVAAGSHTLVARLRDSARPSGYDYETVLEIALRAGQIAVIDFDRNRGSFVQLE